MCEFHGSNGNGFGDIWWTDNPIYFSSIDDQLIAPVHYVIWRDFCVQIELGVEIVNLGVE